MGPQPVCLGRVVFGHAKQERLTAVSEGGVLGRGSAVVQLEGQGKNLFRHPGSQHRTADRDVRHQVPWVFASSSSSRQTFGPPAAVCGISPCAALACQSLLIRSSCIYRLDPRTPPSSILPTIRRNNNVQAMARTSSTHFPALAFASAMAPQKRIAPDAMRL